MLIASAMILAPEVMAVPTVGEVDSFDAWAAEQGKAYTVEEEASRRAIFEENSKMIDAHNEAAAAGEFTFTMGIGPFADLTSEEYMARVLTPFERTEPRDETFLTEVEADVSAAGVDWRTSGAVTPVKNQAKCGSCWSFSTTGSIEGAWKIAGHDLVSLSEQQLVDCAGGKYGNKGCQGGSMDEAMKYVKDNGGLDLESDYQYEAANGKCNLEKEGQHHAFITGHTDVPQNNEAQLEAAVTKGPVSVAIEADKPVFQHYKGGVLNSAQCGTKLDHGVLTVGYGTDSTSSLDYWIVKNSWGPTWGEKGYIRLSKGEGKKQGTCGIAMQPVYPISGTGPAPPPSPGPAPGPSPPPGPSPGGKCNVPTSQRVSCGLLLGKDACEAKNCCYDNTHFFAAHCFHPGTPGPAPGACKRAHGGHYADPAKGCGADEQAVSITGLTGDFCSPCCSDSIPCPTDVPGGATAIPQCALETSGSTTATNCALICGGSGGHGGTCPTGASCQKIQNTAICTYPKADGSFEGEPWYPFMDFFEEGPTTEEVEEAEEAPVVNAIF
jgi:C1A family cysteine protease